MQWPPSMSAALVGGVKTLGAAALCLAYVAAATLLWGGGVPGRGMSLFSHPGRMSLTNYLAQSVCGVAVFYGVGFGYWGRLGPTGSVVLIGVIFGAQALFSAWWLGRFRYGPVEWGWRCVTYWRRLPIRRVSLRQGVILRAPPSRRGDSGSAATTEPACR